ncbi:hypothetical protein D0Z07_2712 [Hyphodiscus hymeniophilus]|uniref:Pentatricopeptide repeat-containing protein n=1 Tax=Hyphodiscus hymeniophilus TaxID=353542 RepID=A0A9P7AZ15_9HELO|nr:hypothetical protein D0Z07_2712 [Hyphodiscus hymeniophilus]
MPPTQRLLAPGIQGFVCRSCLSKLRPSRSQRPLWLSRSTASDNGPRKSRLFRAKEGSHEQPRKDYESVVRVWDETSDGVRTERGTDPGEKALLETLESTIQDMRQEMSAKDETEEIDEDELQDRVLGRHMQDMVQGDGMVDMVVEEMESLMTKLDPEVDKRLEKMDLENISEEERFKIGGEIFASLLKERQKPDPEPFSPSEPTQQGSSSPNQEFPSEFKEQLPVFVDALRSATTLLGQGRLNKPASVEIWNAWNLCRINFMSNPNQVPSEVWEALWNIFADKKTINYGFLKLLGQDMTDAGLPMQNWQRLVHIQATFAMGSCDAAIKMWEESEATLSSDIETSIQYWQVGGKMYTEQCQLDKALGATQALIQSTNDCSHFRGVLPIIRALLSSQEAAKIQKAWALYTRIKLGLGHQMVMKDYDNVAATFFEADQPELALGVFRDMMLGGDATASKDDSTVLNKNAPALQKDLHLMNIDEGEIAWDDPRVVSKIPAKFNNKFFFGKWLKKLIGDGEYNSSVKVFHLMNERGIRPDARYVNGLVGAWLRTGKPKYHELAEDTCWRMIEARLEYFENRDTRPELSFPLRSVNMGVKPGYKSVWHYPRATVETFSILIMDYRRRQRQDRLKDLMKALELARIQPNNFLMNQIMMMDSATVPNFQPWDTYTSLTRTRGVHPDFDTFGYLWHLTKRAVDPNSNPAQFPKVVENVQNLAVPRLMIAEMAFWADKLNRRNKLPRKLYDAIILTFSLAQDHVGTAITLRLLQRHFHMFPNEDTVRTVVLQLARSGLKNEDHPRRRRLAVRKSPVVKDRVVQVTKLLEGFKARRVAELSRQGIVFEELSEVVRLEETLSLMTHLLRHVTQVRVEEGHDVDELFEIAAKDMGVPECVPAVPTEKLGSGK